MSCPRAMCLADSPVDTVYLSELSSAALRRRAEQPLPDWDAEGKTVRVFPAFSASKRTH